MLGSSVEADDAVQEAWLRLSRTDADAIENLGGLAHDGRLARVPERAAVAPRAPGGAVRAADVPEPAAGPDPEHEALLADSIGLALLVVLDTLSPAERVAFVLHDMFAVPFEEIAPIVGRNAPATRQLASRARRRVQGDDEDGEPDVVTAGEARRGVPRRRPRRRLRRRCSRCSTPTSCSAPTPPRWSWARRSRPTAPTPSAGSHAARAAPRRRSSTARRPRSGCRAASCASSTCSASPATGSPRSTLIADPARLSRLDFREP